MSESSAPKSFLDDRFKIKDLGLLNYFLGIEVCYLLSNILLFQKKFISYLLSAYNYADVSVIFSPLDMKHKLYSNIGELLPQPKS